MKEQFKEVNLGGVIKINLGGGRYWESPKATILMAIIEICEEYQKIGYTLTLRQMYYQLVSKDLIPNHDKVYKKLSKLKDDVVYSGMVDWSVFEDRGRIPKRAYFEEDVKSALLRTIDFYKLDRQHGQTNHIEVWTEKDAISDILQRVTNPYTIHLVVNKGYSSSTAMYASYRRFMDAIGNGQKIVILYFGDHDPSGLDMVRDIKDRIIYFMSEGSAKAQIKDMIIDWSGSIDFEIMMDKYGHNGEYWKKIEDEQVFNWILCFFSEHFEIKHIGLTMEQIRLYSPPPNPAKITDPRAANYIKKHGRTSYEVDALKPPVMTKIVEDAITEYMDMDVYKDLMESEKEDRDKLTGLIDTLDQ